MSFPKFDDDKLLEQKQKLREWMEKNQIRVKVNAKSPIWARLTNHRYTLETEFSSPYNFIDHTDVYEDILGDRILISQPYNDEGLKPDEYIDKSILDWCNEHGLSVRGSMEESWYFPGRTILLEFRVVDLDKYDEALQKIRDWPLM
jgi:hypothetical protein